MTRRRPFASGTAGAARAAVTDLLTALALVLVIEGAVLALFPGALKRMLAQLETLPPETLRLGGLTAAGLGVLFVWLLRG